VLPFYKQLDVKKYFGGYLLHPYMSWYTGAAASPLHFLLCRRHRGTSTASCPSTRVQDVKYVKENFPKCGNLLRRRHADDITTGWKNWPRHWSLKVVWSCNARPMCAQDLGVMKAMVFVCAGRYESGNQQILHNIKKACYPGRKRFAKDCTIWHCGARHFHSGPAGRNP